MVDTYEKVSKIHKLNNIDLKKDFKKLSKDLDECLDIPEISGIIRLNRNVKIAIDVYSDT